MKTVFELTPEIRKEIESSIIDFNNLIKKEMLISVDLRKHDKVVLYTNTIVKLQKALIDGML